MIFFTESGVDL